MKKSLGAKALIVLAIIFASCEKPIEGELERLLDDTQQAANTPRWSYDGSKIYFIYDSGTNSGRLGVYDFSTGEDTALSDPWMPGFDISRFSDLILTNEGGWFWIRKPETWEVVDSSKACEKALDVVLTIHGPKYSYESSQSFYYLFWREPDSLFLHKVDLSLHSDEEVLIINSEERGAFAPGSGDTLFAISDTMYNLKSGEKIPLGIRPIELQWNPAAPNELLVVKAAAKDEDLYLFSLQERRLNRIKVELPEIYSSTSDARFSPDGKSIVLVGEQYSDGGDPLYLWLYKIKE